MAEKKAKRFCCKKMDNSFGDCTEDQYKALPNDERQVMMEGEPCPTGGEAETTPDPEAETTPDPEAETTPDPEDNTTTTATTVASRSYYRTCNGPTYKKFCKDPGSSYGNPNPNGDIYKVQSCLGSRLKLDSYFGPKTLKALQDAGYGSTFTKDDVDEICGTTNTGQSTDGSQETTPTAIKGTEKYWETLIDNEQIYRDGLIYKLKNGEFVYIIKTDINNPDKKYPLDSLSGENPEEYDYLVLYPVQPGDTKGKFNILAYYITANGERKVKQEKNRKWKWEPLEAYETFDLSETIKRKIRNILDEQRIYGRGKKKESSSDGVDTSGGKTTISGRDNTGKTQPSKNQNTKTPAKLDLNKVSEIMTPLKEEALKTLKEWKTYNANLGIGDAKVARLGGKGVLEENINNTISKINSIDPKDFCSDKTLNKLAKEKANAESQEKQYSKLLTDRDKAYISKLKTIINELTSKCKELKSELNQTTTSGDREQTTTSDDRGQTITSDDDDLYEIFGFVDNTGKPFTKSKVETRVKSITRKGGERNYGTLQDAINNSDARSYYFAEYNELINDAGLGEEFILKFPDNFDDMDLAGQEIDDDNESALFPLEDEMLGSDFVKKTFGNFLGTKGTAEIYVAKGQGARMSSSRVKCGAANPRKFLIDYLYNALSTQKARSSSREGRKAEQAKITEQKRVLCGCYNAGAFNKFKAITKKELGSMGKNLQPFKLLDRRLNFREITKLMRGDKVNGRELNPKYVDSAFATENCSAVNESSRLKSNINSLLTEAVVTKRKERTREVIVEDLLKIIKGF